MRKLPRKQPAARRNDWVVFCQMFGTMLDLPNGWPMFCRDIRQFRSDKGNPQLPEQSWVGR